MHLALFDLDHTLLPLDSDYEWGSSSSSIGVVDARPYAAQNDRFYRQYQAGTLDIARVPALPARAARRRIRAAARRAGTRSSWTK